jgi:hypothetical protein
MFGALQNSVTNGMTALGLQVGAAGAREMARALFAFDLATKKSR